MTQAAPTTKHSMRHDAIAIAVLLALSFCVRAYAEDAIITSAPASGVVSTTEPTTGVTPQQAVPTAATAAGTGQTSTTPALNGQRVVQRPPNMPAPLSGSGVVAPAYPGAYPLYVPFNSSLGACGSGGISICNTVVPVPSQLPVGSVMNLSMPSPFKHEAFTVTCVLQSGIYSYQITDQSQVSCTLQSCAPQTVQICSHDVAVQGGAKLGDTVTVNVPPGMLSDTTYSPASFDAVCGDDGNGALAYHMRDANQFSCNNFNCADTIVHLCGTDIAVKGGAHMGEIVHQTMPEPFVADDFTMQCLGTQGKAPAYQTFNVTGVSCDRMR